MDVTLNQRVMVALDVQGREEALDLAKALARQWVLAKSGLGTIRVYWSSDDPRTERDGVSHFSGLEAS